MGKEIKITNPINNPFAGIKSYSVEEIIAAGGTTAFANKIGKGSAQSLIDYLDSLPEEAFLTKEEADAALKDLRENK